MNHITRQESVAAGKPVTNRRKAYKGILRKYLCMMLSVAVVFFCIPAVPAMAAAYDPPTALRVLWMETGGLDQTATCHQWGDYITNVTLSKDETNLLVCRDGIEDNSNYWHTDFGRTTPQIPVAEVVTGQSYQISVTVDGDDISFHYLAVYIDWNQDNKNGTVEIGMPTDTNEEVAEWYNYGPGSGPKTLTRTFTVPNGIPVGKVYMRVMLDAENGGENGGDHTCSPGTGDPFSIKWTAQS